MNTWVNVRYLNYDHISRTVSVVLLKLGSYVLNLIVIANLHIKVKGVATARFRAPSTQQDILQSSISF